MSSTLNNGSSLQKRKAKANPHNLAFQQKEHMVKFIGNWKGNIWVWLHIMRNFTLYLLVGWIHYLSTLIYSEQVTLPNAWAFIVPTFSNVILTRSTAILPSHVCVVYNRCICICFLLFACTIFSLSDFV